MFDVVIVGAGFSGIVLAEHFASRDKKILINGTKISILEPMRSQNTDLQFLAKFLYEKIFLNYTEKQWGISPEEI